MEWVRKVLFNTAQPLWRYCLIAFPLALLPSLALSAAAEWVAAATDLHPSPAPQQQLTPGNIFSMLVFGPAAETLLLAFVLLLLSGLTRRTLPLAGLSAFVWALFHGAFGALWFFGVIWSFFVFSCAYLAWRPRSFARGFLAAAVPHALVNTTVVLFVASGYG